MQLNRFRMQLLHRSLLQHGQQEHSVCVSGQAEMLLDANSSLGSCSQCGASLKTSELQSWGDIHTDDRTSSSAC